MWKDSGSTAPRLAGEVSPERVAQAVIKAIRGQREVLVTSGPLRPLLALNQLFPGLQRPLIKRMGIDRAMRRPYAAAPSEEREPADLT